MTKITAGAALGIKLTIAPYQNIDPNFWCGWEEEMPEGSTDEEILARIKEITDVCRKECEDRIDEDIENVNGKKVFKHIVKEKK